MRADGVGGRGSGGFLTFDNAGNLGQDSSPMGNNLNTSGSPSYTAGGRFGGAVDLDGLGQNDILVQGASFPTGVPTGNASYTISAWINPDNSSNSGGFIGWGNYGTNNQVNAFRMETDDGLWNYWWGNDYGNGTYSGINFKDGQWHHVAVAYDSVTGTQIMYVDGVPVQSATGRFGLDVRPENFRIGTAKERGFH